MRKLILAASSLAAVMSLAACVSGDSPAEVQSSDTGTTMDETTAEAVESTAPAAVTGPCAEEPIATAMNDIVTIAGFHAVEPEPDDTRLFNCAWGSSEYPTEQAFLYIEENTEGIDPDIAAEGMGNNFGVSPIEDPRLEAAGAVAWVEIGCEGGSASGAAGCKIMVFGDDAYVTLSVRNGGDVSQDQMVDAAWTMYEALYA